MKDQIKFTIVIVFWCYIIFFIVSCKNKVTEIQIIEKINQDVNISTNTFTHGKNWLSSYKIISFQKNDDSLFLLSTISKVILNKGIFFILDGRFSNLYAFNSGGKYIRKYGAIGLGINEYKKINDFDIDTIKNQIIILSEDNAALYYYDLYTSKFVKKLNLKIYGNQFCQTEKNEILLYRNFNTGDKGDGYNLVLLDSTGNLKSKAFPYNAKLSNIGWKSTGFLRKTGKRILFAGAYNDTVYCFINNSFNIKNIINIGSKNIKANLLTLNNVYNKKFLLDSSTSLLGNSFFANERFVVFNYQSKLKIKSAIYNTNLKEISNLTESDNKNPLMYVFFTPMMLDNHSNLYLKFSKSDIQNIAKKYPIAYTQLLIEQPQIKACLNQQSEEFLLITNLQGAINLNYLKQ